MNKMRNKKMLLLMSAFAFIIIVSSIPTPVQAGLTKSWHNLGMTGGNPLWGYYDPGTMKAEEQLMQPPSGPGVYVFSNSWETVNAVPGGSDIFDVRVKFYFKAYYWWWIFYYTEGMDVYISTFDGEHHWGTYTYYPSNYQNGAYVYIYLGSDAEYNKLWMRFSDKNDESDLGYDAWTLGSPVVQVYTYDY